MQEAAMETLLDDAFDAAADAFDEADFGFEGELSFQAFMEALCDPVVCQKIADATKIPLEVVQNLDAAEMEAFFVQIDTDMSGTVSFMEWVKAMVEMRKQTHAQEK